MATRAALVSWVTAALVLLVAAPGWERGAEAQDGGAAFTFVAFDTTLNQIEDIEAAQLAAKMVFSNTGEGSIFLGEYSDHAEEPRSFESADEAQVSVDEIIERLESNIGREPYAANLSEMMERYSSFIEQLPDVAGGRLFVLSAGGFTVHESTGVAGLTDVAADLALQRVEVRTISLATTPGADREALAAISDADGGRSYDLGFLEGVIEFIDDQLNVLLHATLRVEDASAAGESITVDIPPHSSYLVAGFAFEDSATSNVIVQPNGQVIGDSVGSVSVISISGMKFYTVRNPQPGVWKLESSGGSGAITFFSDVINQLGVVMPDQAPFPTGETFVLTAEARAGELPLIDTSAIIDAIVKGPDGSEHSYELNDRGADGDVFSEDGIFSTTIGPLEIVGVSNVQLIMRWPNLTATIEGGGSFAIEPFPTIEINSAVADAPITEGEKTHLATVDLILGEFPFLAESEHVTVSMIQADDGSEVDIELKPTEVVDGKIYQLNVFAALVEPGDYEFDAILRSSHLEREFVAVATTRTESIEIAVPTPVMTYVLYGIAGFFAFVFLVLLIRAILQHNPFGYLYRLDSSGERELVANFAEYRRSPWDWLMNKSIVPAAALPGVPLLGGRFVFSTRGIAFRYRPDSDGLLRMTIRGEALQTGKNMIADNEEFQIAGETFVFDRARTEEEVRVSDRIRSVQQERNAELESFALDPMTWDAPSSARPTRRVGR
ncbi:MAG: hypothetical protein F4X40_08110 [Chloroflexi bacterium]|nr:hypothetical protein [Chloroflexota bacterium]